MREKDVMEKALEAHNDVFADIVNTLLFDGEAIVQEEELEERAPRSRYRAGKGLREQERDVLKGWRHGEIRVALYGIENQTSVDRDMPLRIIGYDGAAYREQLLSREGARRERYPVITLVLYFGSARWKKPLSLRDCFEVPEYLRPYFSDYPIHVYEIAHLTEEKVRQFRSDFRIVADYFVQTEKNGGYEPSDMEMSHAEETLSLMAALTQDPRFEEIAEKSGKGGIRTMCEVLDRAVASGLEQGWREGRRRGQEEGRREAESKMSRLLRKLLDAGRLEDIRRISEDGEYRRKLLDELEAESR